MNESRTDTVMTAPDTKIEFVRDYVSKKINGLGDEMRQVKDPDGAGQAEYRNLLAIEEVWISVQYGLEWAVGNRKDWPFVEVPVSDVA